MAPNDSSTVPQPSLRVVPGGPQRLEDLGDDDLMLLVGADRSQAFEVLVRRYQRLVWGVATRSVGDRALGRDLAQDVFLSLWAERRRYRPSGRFKGYLLGMTMHRCRHAGRLRRDRTRKLEEQGPKAEPATELQGEALERLLASERAKKVREGLQELPEKHREVLILRFTHGLPLAEISEAVGAPLGTVKSLLFRGLARLSALLEKEPQ